MSTIGILQAERHRIIIYSDIYSYCLRDIEMSQRRKITLCECIFSNNENDLYCLDTLDDNRLRLQCAVQKL